MSENKVIKKEGRSNNIEDKIHEDYLPVNSLVMANRLIDLLRENNTNCLLSLKDNIQVKKLLWLLNSQVFGELSIIDMSELWNELKNQEE